MPKYLTKAQLSSQGVAAMVSNPQNRADALRPSVEAAGGKLEQYYFDVTANAVYTIAEMPDNESVAALMSAAFSGGAIVSYSVSPIMTAEEMVDAFKKAAEISYQPPSA